ncbi:biopolymer transporter ExbD [Candidatus Marinamargulisbacteria bacterium SCGC AG-343-D04]|nr:biopolymer transporter ExbD [Candidatus Marinamargulisbacteria bacterium SCGC AG-343-D04]
MFKYTRKTKKAKLSIAPLLDMIFILLIFFVVSTTFSKLPGVLIDKPEAMSSDRLPPNNMLIGITKEGHFFVNNKEYTLELLKEKLELKVSSNPNVSVIVVADKESVLRHTISVMDLCKQMGIQDIAIAEELIQ